MPSSLEVNGQGQGFSTVDRAGTAPAEPWTAPACPEGADLTHGAAGGGNSVVTSLNTI